MFHSICSGCRCLNFDEFRDTVPLFSYIRPTVEVTPEVTQPTRKTSTPKTPPASKTTPPRPAPKPKPSSKTKEPEVGYLNVLAIGPLQLVIHVV